MRIFIHRGTRTFGPYSLQDVRHELGNGSLKPTDMATYEGGGDKSVPLSAVPGVAVTVSGGSPRSQSAGQTPKQRRRVGCCGWIAIALLFITVVMGIEYLTEKKTEPVVSNGVASVEVIAGGYTSGDLDDHGLHLDLAVNQVAQTVWETANEHPDVHSIIVHLYMKTPVETHRDRYGNETSFGGDRMHLCDVEVGNLANVRLYRDAEAYAVHDSDVVYFYKQKIEPGFRQYRAHINNGVD